MLQTRIPQAFASSAQTALQLTNIVKRLALPFRAAAFASLSLSLSLSLGHAHTCARLVVMLRRVLVVAGLAQLSHASSSLARSQCRHLLLLASRSRPSASPLGKPWLHNGTKPLHCLSAAHCLSSSTTSTITVRATLLLSINHSIILESVSMQVSH